MQTLKKMKTDHGEVITLREGDRDADTQRKNIQQQSLATTTTILDLKDDCLHEIFALQRVSAVDLCSLAQTCTKLRQIAIDIFARSQKNCNFDSLAVAESVMATRVIKTFGASIVALRMDFLPYTLGGEKIIESILENCSALKAFTIKSYKIPDNEKHISTMALLFEKLEVLSMIDVHIEGFDAFIFAYYPYSRIITSNGNLMKFFENCSSLVYLSIDNCHNLERCCFETYFPKLQHFEYRFNGGSTEPSIEGILFRHPTLKSFSFEGYEYEDIRDMLKIIGTNCKQLEKLHIEISSYDEFYESSSTLVYLKQLEHLTELKIDWDHQSMIALVSQLQSKSLKVLEIVNFENDSESIPAISKIKTLRSLKLRPSCDSGYLQNLNELGNLTELTELVIDHGFIDFRFDQYYDFNVDLIGIIKRLMNLTKFKFHLSNFKTRTTFHITKCLFIQMVNEVEGRPVASNRYMEIDCPKTDDIANLSCPTVVFKELE